VVIILVLIAALVAGSLYALIRPSDSRPLFRIGGTGNAVRFRQSPGEGEAGGNTAVFSGIGRLRIPAAGQPPVTVILSVSFPYPADDLLFTEELAARIGDFRSIATEYFASLSAEKIANLDEGAAKAEILKRYNNLLRLGRIETLYFSDLMTVE
jgi:flagellar basal body-associated protein FliL